MHSPPVQPFDTGHGSFAVALSTAFSIRQQLMGQTSGCTCSMDVDLSAELRKPKKKLFAAQSDPLPGMKPAGQQRLVYLKPSPAETRKWDRRGRFARVNTGEHHSIVLHAALPTVLICAGRRCWW